MPFSLKRYYHILVHTVSYFLLYSVTLLKKFSCINMYVYMRLFIWNRDLYHDTIKREVILKTNLKFGSKRESTMAEYDWIYGQIWLNIHYFCCNNVYNKNVFTNIIYWIHSHDAILKVKINVTNPKIAIYRFNWKVKQ